MTGRDAAREQLAAALGDGRQWWGDELHEILADLLPVVDRIANERAAAALEAAAGWLCDEADDDGAPLCDSTGREMISGPAFRNVEWAAQSLADRAAALRASNGEGL